MGLEEHFRPCFQLTMQEAELVSRYRSLTGEELDKFDRIFGRAQESGLNQADLKVAAMAKLHEMRRAA